MFPHSECQEGWSYSTLHKLKEETQLFVQRRGGAERRRKQVSLRLHALRGKVEKNQLLPLKPEEKLSKS